MNPAEFLYYLGYSFKKRLSVRRQKRLPYKVISIGNITVGGTGKTPAAIAVAEEALKRGFRPVILTRGYGGRAKGPCLVNEGGHVLSVEEAGDEPVVIAGRLKDVPVVKSADRYEGGTFAVRHLSNDSTPLLFILDDGFQHWRLARDLDVVLVDGLDPFGNRKLLPVGPLRGPVGELGSADIIVITKARNSALAAEIKGINNHAPFYFASAEVTGIRGSEGGLVDAGLINGRSVLAFCGIANPASFRETITTLGGIVAGLQAYRDHYRYTQKDMIDIEKVGKGLGADFLVTTEKDIVKLRELPRVPSNLLSIEIGFKIDAGFYDTMFGKLQ
jgi:tetraacyldisaccharide 4'-kinase